MAEPFPLVKHAAQQRWLPDDPLALEVIARWLERGDPVTIVQQAGKRLTSLPDTVQVVDAVPVDHDPARPVVIISDRLLGPRPEVDRLVVLRPPTLALGIACRRHLELDDLKEAVRLFSRRSGYSQQSIMALAASSRRRELAALEDLAEQLQVPLLLYDDPILKRSPLPAPGKVAGTCAVAAILAAGVTTPLIQGTPFFRLMTLSLARRSG